MIEIPPRFTAHPPVGPETEERGKRMNLTLSRSWPGASGLAEDVRRYGSWMRTEAQKRIGNLYPLVEVSAAIARDRADLTAYIGQKLTVIAWIWVRTVKSPNPAFSQVDVPLASTFILSSNEGKESYVQPVVEGDRYHFRVKKGTPPPEAKNGTKLGRGASFSCLVSGAAIEPKYIYAEALGKRMGSRLMAIVAEGVRGRVYLQPTSEAEVSAATVEAAWKPELLMPVNPRWFSPPLYGLTTFGDLFTRRQLMACATFSELVEEVREKIRQDALAAGMPDDITGCGSGGTGATAYAEAVGVYLAFAFSRVADYGCSLATWRHKDSAMRSGIPEHALPMTWDFAEGNPFGKSSSGFKECADVVARVISASLAPPSNTSSEASQRNAAESGSVAELPASIISTDPPYYDNIGYADLSDFYYIWLRRNLRATYPSLFATLTVPKAEELVATPYRHGGTAAAEAYFLEGMTVAMSNLAAQSHPAFPITIYYAFKQTETKASETSSTGWDTFLAAVIQAGLSITGTWPIRTEGDNRQVGVGNNALASSIVLVCRPRPLNAPTVSRREFLRELNVVLPEALDEMTKGSGDDRSPIAPVDLSQAIIGPGMAVFSKYVAVLEADGSFMSVRTALQLINRFLAEDDFDADTQFCLHWFEQHVWTEGAFGDAETLSRSKGTSVNGMKDAGILKSGNSKVRLLRWADYPTDWDPRTDSPTPVWEALHQLIRALKQGGESASGALLAALGGKAEAVRQLAYRLYTLCERLGQAEDARAYNELITSWTGIESAAASAPKSGPAQGTLFEPNEH